MVKNMDTSEKYIEMCRAAEEIQKEWNPKIGDRYWLVGSHHFGTTIVIDVDAMSSVWSMWIPRQDQLQDLLGDDLRDIAEGFYDYMTTGGYDYECPEFNDARCKEYGSMEQLWLAYVMETKYGKQWDDSSWRTPGMVHHWRTPL